MGQGGWYRDVEHLVQFALAQFLEPEQESLQHGSCISLLASLLNQEMHAVNPP